MTREFEGGDGVGNGSMRMGCSFYRGGLEGQRKKGSARDLSRLERTKV